MSTPLKPGDRCWFTGKTPRVATNTMLVIVSLVGDSEAEVKASTGRWVHTWTLPLGQLQHDQYNQEKYNAAH